MVTIITIIISILIAINFILLKFSCNKIIKEKRAERPLIITKKTTVITTQQPLDKLAPTGS